MDPPLLNTAEQASHSPGVQPTGPAERACLLTSRQCPVGRTHHSILPAHLLCLMFSLVKVEGSHGPEAHSPCKQHACLLGFTLGICSPKSRVLAKKWGADGALPAEQYRKLLRAVATLWHSAQCSPVPGAHWWRDLGDSASLAPLPSEVPRHLPTLPQANRILSRRVPPRGLPQQDDLKLFPGSWNWGQAECSQTTVRDRGTWASMGHPPPQEQLAQQYTYCPTPTHCKGFPGIR